jgi:hypothetical protein
MNSAWHILEDVPAHSAAAADWKLHLGGAYAAAKEAFLQKAKRKASSVQCPHIGGCTHELKPRGDEYVAKCKDDDGAGCDDFVLSADAAEVWEVNLKRLGAGIAGALKCLAKDQKLELDRTRQIASLGNAPLPILLTVQDDEDGFGNVVARLVARWPKGFILLAPTSRFCTATATDMLGRVNAGFFDLATHVELLDSGKLHAPKSGEELFAELLADRASHRKEIERPTARYVFRQAGSWCDIAFDGCEVFHLNNTDGAKYLDHLLHHPNKPIRAFDLEAAIKSEKAKVRDENSIQTAVDGQAKREARQELVTLKAELEEAQAERQTAKVKRLKDEITKVQAVVGNESLLGGDTGERGRDNVRKAIEKIKTNLRKGNKDAKAFGVHVGRFVSLGYNVEYNQPESVSWD